MLIGTIAYFSWGSLAGQKQTASSQSAPSIPSYQPSAPVVPDPTDPPTPSPSISVRTSVRAHAVAVAPVAVQSASPAPRSSPTISPYEQYRQDEVVRTLASRRASSVLKLTQDDQARQDLADAGVSDRPATVRQYPPAEPQAIPAPSSTSMFASDSSNGVDKFIGQHKTDAGYVAPVSTYQVDAGTYVQAVTSSTVDNTLPDGVVRCMITSPVYSSRGGHNVVVIPQGTELLVTYNSHATQGAARLQSVGTRLVFEDGREFDLGGSSQAAGMQGEAGMPVSSVDTHAGKAFGNAVLAALLQAVVNESSRSSTNISLGSSTALQAPQQLPPTMHVRAGTPFTFVVGEDLPL